MTRLEYRGKEGILTGQATVLYPKTKAYQITAWASKVTIVTQLGSECSVWICLMARVISMAPLEALCRSIVLTTECLSHGTMTTMMRKISTSRKEYKMTFTEPKTSHQRGQNKIHFMALASRGEIKDRKRNIMIPKSRIQIARLAENWGTEQAETTPEAEHHHCLLLGK